MQAMDKVNDAVSVILSKLIPLVAADQAIYAVTIKSKRHRPECFGGDGLIIMFAGLHIGMVAFNSISSLLE